MRQPLRLCCWSRRYNCDGTCTPTRESSCSTGMQAEEEEEVPYSVCTVCTRKRWDDVITMILNDHLSLPSGTIVLQGERTTTRRQSKSLAVDVPKR